MAQHEFKNGDKVHWKNDSTVYLYVGAHPKNYEKTIHVLYAHSEFFCAYIEDLKPYKEPVKVSGWVNVYANHHSNRDVSIQGIYASRVEANYDKLTERVACVYVNGTEGKEP